MPSPFPGMDPFVEAQRWEPFHAAFVPVLSELLVPQLRPRYTVDIQRYTFLIDETDEPIAHYAPDTTVVDGEYASGLHPSQTVATLEPKILTLAMQADFEQKYLVIRSRERRDVIALIELLSPWNKTNKGQDEYLQKRANYLRTETHIIELDLLRGGRRLPLLEPLPPGEYFAFIGRSDRRPKVEAYAWPLRAKLPVIPVPLKAGDPDVSLDLQEAFTRTYDRGGYDYALDYRQDVVPRLSANDREWVSGLLRDPPAPGRVQ